MAIGRAVLYRESRHESASGDWAQRLWRWRHWALFLLALLAGAMATVSLITNPSESPPPATSYLPAPQTPAQ